MYNSYSEGPRIWNSFPVGLQIIDDAHFECYLKSPAYRLYFTRVIFLSFFSPHIFDVPGPMFAKLPHDAVCSEIGGIHMCPLKILQGETPPPIFGQFPDQ